MVMKTFITTLVDYMINIVIVVIKFVIRIGVARNV